MVNYHQALIIFNRTELSIIDKDTICHHFPNVHTRLSIESKLMISNFIPRVSNYFDSQLEAAEENKVVVNQAGFA